MKYPSPSTRRLLELARGQDDPDPTALDRVANTLQAKVAEGATLAKPAQVGGASSIAAKSLGVVAVVSALAGAGWVGLRAVRASRPPLPQAVPLVADAPAGRHVQEPPPSEPPAASPMPPAPEPAPAALRGEPSKARVFRKPARANAESGASAGAAPIEETTDQLRAETAALRLAEEALRDGSPAQALSLLDEQDARFRNGTLQQERAAARVLALCQQGHVAEARAQAARFERTWPRSGLRARIQSACWAP